MPEIRLQRFLAQAGVAARRKAETLIERGAVAVNGRVVTKLGTKVDPDNDHVTVDGEAVQADDHVYVVLNKPKACITAVTDPQGRRTVMEYVPGLPASVVPVGRLDFYSEGVLLLTNDGELAAALTSPKTHVEKTYHVKVKRRLSAEDVEALESGVRIGPHTVTRPALVDRLRSQSKHEWVVITLTEGKSRQIHRMLEALGHEVLKLQRVAFGTITFHGLRVGDARELTQAEVDELRELAGLRKSPRATSRGTWQVRREETEVARRARDRARALPTPNPTPGGSRKGTAALRARQAELAAAAPPRPPRPAAGLTAARTAAGRPRPGAASRSGKAGASPRPPAGSARKAAGPQRSAGSKSGPGKRGPGKPSSGRPGAGTPSAGQSAAGKPRRARPGAGGSTASKPSGRRPGAGQSTAGKPSRGRPGAKPSRGRPGAKPSKGPSTRRAATAAPSRSAASARPGKPPRGASEGKRPGKPPRSRPASAKAPGGKRKSKPGRR